MSSPQGSGKTLLAAGVAAAFVLLIAAVWASGAGAATSLALTGVLVLIGVGGLVYALERGPAQPPDASDAQRERMGKTTP